MQVTTEGEMSGKRLVKANEYHLDGHLFVAIICLITYNLFFPYYN